ncbi:lactococcin 972 family bacteriocin [Streptacidiphilus melanogenes]|uniref:lactococcin 972 family bacteriocin n=1 Tax=Streptacidiphilus melanogenes TaxID=411235 RepID=UPI001269E313
MKAPSASAGIRPMTESSCVYPAEGGEWCFGWNFKFVGTAEYKNCYSNYYNGTKTHYASVIIDDSFSGRYYASAGQWADSSLAAGLAYTCYSYHGTS